jgi:hypothetical protein
MRQGLWRAAATGQSIAARNSSGVSRLLATATELGAKMGAREFPVVEAGAGRLGIVDGPPLSGSGTGAGVTGSFIAVDYERPVEMILYDLPCWEGEKGRISAHAGFQLVAVTQWLDLSGAGAVAVDLTCCEGLVLSFIQGLRKPSLHQGQCAVANQV